MSGEHERLFFALWPDTGVRERLARIESDLPPHHGKPAHSEDRHVTLVFLGEMDAERRSCVERAADRVRGLSFDLEIDQVGYWRRPRILWCGPARTPAPLLRLVEDLQQALADCGLRPETRPYAPHITLARKARPVTARPLGIPIPWHVDGFVLVHSTGSALPPRYQVVKRWPLA